MTIPILSPPSSLFAMAYLLHDRFDDNRAAGAVDGTPATPGPGTRTTKEVGENVFSLSGGVLNVTAPGTPAHGNFWMVYGDVPIARKAGRMAISSSKIVTAGFYPLVWSNSKTTIGLGSDTPLGHMMYGTTALLLRDGGMGGATVNVGPSTSATEYRWCVVLRATGAYYFVKGGAFSKWTLLWSSKLDSDATLYVCVGYTYNFAFTTDYVMIPNVLWLPTPLAYDDFTR